MSSLPVIFPKLCPHLAMTHRETKNPCPSQVPVMHPAWQILFAWIKPLSCAVIARANPGMLCHLELLKRVLSSAARVDNSSANPGGAEAESPQGDENQ